MSGEPAGKIVTRAAVSVELWASLVWECQEHVPLQRLLPVLPEFARSSLQESSSVDEPRRTISGEILALGERDLGIALDRALRFITAAAATNEAVLEVQVARVVSSLFPQAQLVEQLAGELWRSGFRVQFGTSWTPAPFADIAVGADGDVREMEALLKDGGAWEVTSLPR